MLEALIVGLAVLGLAGLVLLPAGWAWTAGIGLTGLSLALGVGAGIGYHVRLARCLAGRLPARWWWHPMDHHEALDPADRPRVLRWFYVGAAGFGGCILGLLLVVAAIAKSM